MAGHQQRLFSYKLQNRSEEDSHGWGDNAGAGYAVPRVRIRPNIGVGVRILIVLLQISERRVNHASQASLLPGLFQVKLATVRRGFANVLIVGSAEVLLQL